MKMYIIGILLALSASAVNKACDSWGISTKVATINFDLDKVRLACSDRHDENRNNKVVGLKVSLHDANTQKELSYAQALFDSATDAYIDSVKTHDPEDRNKGYSRYVCKRLINQLHRRSYTKITLDATPFETNLPIFDKKLVKKLVKFYQSLGFTFEKYTNNGYSAVLSMTLKPLSSSSASDEKKS